jgi:hypothetical protein
VLLKKHVFLHWNQKRFIRTISVNNFTSYEFERLSSITLIFRRVRKIAKSDY